MRPITACRLAFMLALVVAPSGAALAQSCNWQQAKPMVESVLSGDKDKAAEFRRLTKQGKDSYDVLLAMVGEAERKAIDACRFEAMEHLSDKGFPPLH